MKRLLSVLLTAVLFASMTPTNMAPEAEAAFAYGKRTFIVTAYYSPLPGQSFYVKGSYAADKRLNGEGIAGASGTPVFPGMLAAPKDYAFGTKIYLQGLGVGSVTDRGGAIVNAGKRGMAYDRLDVWMGHGEEGLRRALRWGKRTVSGYVYRDTSVATTMSFGDNYTPPALVAPSPTTTPSKEQVAKAEVAKKVETIAKTSEFYQGFPSYMGKGANGPSVKMLQAALSKLGYYSRGMTGTYDGHTITAVLRYQLDKKIVDSKDAYAAGYFGVETRKQMMQSLLSKGTTMKDLQDYAFRASEPEEKEQLIASVKEEATPYEEEKKVEAVTSPVEEKKEETKALVTTAISQPPVLEGKSTIVFEDKAFEVKPSTRTPNLASIPQTTVEVRAMQKRLRSLGLYQGEFTGVYGATTKRALITLQYQGGLTKKDGTYNAETRDYLENLWLKHVETWGFARRLKKGDANGDVEKLQKLLTELKYYNGPIDGTFDEQVERSLVKFQLDHKVVRDKQEIGTGTVGPKTMATMNRILFRL